MPRIHDPYAGRRHRGSAGRYRTDESKMFQRREDQPFWRDDDDDEPEHSTKDEQDAMDVETNKPQSTEDITKYTHPPMTPSVPAAPLSTDDDNEQIAPAKMPLTLTTNLKKRRKKRKSGISFQQEDEFALNPQKVKQVTQDSTASHLLVTPKLPPLVRDTNPDTPFYTPCSPPGEQQPTNSDIEASPSHQFFRSELNALKERHRVELEQKEKQLRQLQKQHDKESEAKDATLLKHKEELVQKDRQLQDLIAAMDKVQKELAAKDAQLLQYQEEAATAQKVKFQLDETRRVEQQRLEVLEQELQEERDQRAHALDELQVEQFQEKAALYMRMQMMSQTLSHLSEGHRQNDATVRQQCEELNRLRQEQFNANRQIEQERGAFARRQTMLEQREQQVAMKEMEIQRFCTMQQPLHQAPATRGANLQNDPSNKQERRTSGSRVASSTSQLKRKLQDVIPSFDNFLGLPDLFIAGSSKLSRPRNSSSESRKKKAKVADGRHRSGV